MKAVLLLLLAVGTAAAPHVNFLQFSQNGRPSGDKSISCLGGLCANSLGSESLYCTD